MRKIVCILLILFPCVSYGVDIHKKFRWSYMALAETMYEMRNNCEPTSAKEFTSIGDWLIARNAYVSLWEIANYCMDYAGFRNIARSKAHPCKIPDTNCKKGTCGEWDLTTNRGCNIFLSTFIKKNNESVVMLRYRDKPGTYVKLVNKEQGLWQVVDVVLAKGYRNKNGAINSGVNSAPDNTRIYELNADGTAEYTGFNTWTNDMFMDIAAAGNLSGAVRGAFRDSYIWPNIDVTDDLYALHFKYRGTPDFSRKVAEQSGPGGEFDFKKRAFRQETTQEWNSAASHSNGVMFEGKIAHYDWLGHFLFGMNQQESLVPNVASEAVAQGLSVVGGITSGQFKKEPFNLQEAWRYGREWVITHHSSRDNYYLNTEVDTPNRAFQLASERMIETYGGIEPITCMGNCNNTTDQPDVVACVDALSQLQEFEFKGMCLKKIKEERQKNIDPVSSNTSSHWRM